MAWTPWRKIADRLFWYVEHGLHIPVCYELGLAEPNGQTDPRVVYLGTAQNEFRELTALGNSQHALSLRIRGELDKDLALYYRATGAPTMTAAEELRQQRNRGRYAWNET